MLDNRCFSVHDIFVPQPHSHQKLHQWPDDQDKCLKAEASYKNERMISILIPASSGRPGPGEMTIAIGFISSISAMVISSFLFTMISFSTSPKY